MKKKRTHKEENMAIAEASSTSKNYDSLFAKIDALQGIEKQKFTKSLTLEEKKSYIRHCKERDCEIVSGIFRSFEPLGSILEMTGMAYEGEIPIKYTFYDGEQYSVPNT